MNQEYEEKMMEAYIGTPDRLLWYQKAFETFKMKCDKQPCWYWNSWAMAGGFWYFLYRKQMKIALTVLMVTLVAGALIPIGLFPLAFVIMSVLTGGYGTYFVYSNYLDKKEEIEAVLSDDERRVIAMSRLGGVNRWVIYAGLFALVSSVLIVVELFILAGKTPS